MFSSVSSQAQSVLETEFSFPVTDLGWQFPRENAHGDISTSVALRVAKQVQQPPRAVAEALVKGISECDDVVKAEVAGAGYVNVWLTPSALVAALEEASAATKPKKKRAKEAPVIVEYSQPNIAKPLGIHHILSTVVGQSLSNIHRHLGFSTVAINHLGDWGTQFGKLSVAVHTWGTKPAAECSLADFLELYVRFHEEAEKNPDLEDEARAAFTKLEKGDKKLREFREVVLATTMREVEAVYERLHIQFDHVHGESFYEDKMTSILEEGRTKGVFIEGEKGALIAKFPEESGLPPAIVLKGDGSTIYHTRDLATIRYRVDTWHPQSMLYVVDTAQSLYFQQLFAMVHQLGWELPALEHVVLGRMRFADRSMSTRKGNILRLQEVLDEAVSRASKIIKERGESIQTDDPADLAEMMGTGAVVYGILSQNRKMDIVFDWDKMLSFEGNSAPYLQYTHARALSLLRKANAEKPVTFPQDMDALEDAERLVLKTLLQFPAALTEACTTHMPHKLANFLYQLCQDFNVLYNVLPILKAEESVRNFRLALTSLTASVLHTGAELLTLRLPERM